MGNDIANALPTANVLSFADDTVIYCEHTDIKFLYVNAIFQLQNFFNCLCVNMLYLNADGTNYLIIYPRQRKYDKTNRHLTITEYEIAEIRSTGRSKHIDEHLT